jgi:hypothetical protein
MSGTRRDVHRGFVFDGEPELSGSSRQEAQSGRGSTSRAVRARLPPPLGTAFVPCFPRSRIANERQRAVKAVPVCGSSASCEEASARTVDVLSDDRRNGGQRRREVPVDRHFPNLRDVRAAVLGDEHEGVAPSGGTFGSRECARVNGRDLNVVAKASEESTRAKPDHLVCVLLLKVGLHEPAGVLLSREEVHAPVDRGVTHFGGVKSRRRALRPSLSGTGSVAQRRCDSPCRHALCRVRGSSQTCGATRRARRKLRHRMPSSRRRV